ncbi:MAG TPA: hypothetical protein VK978_00110 [Candidatus Saccharimonadales bacterium]|nr:hypothetical protein [Candidatus Saccharimonadales bacterium]
MSQIYDRDRSERDDTLPGDLPFDPDEEPETEEPGYADSLPQPCNRRHRRRGSTLARTAITGVLIVGGVYVDEQYNGGEYTHAAAAWIHDAETNVRQYAGSLIASGTETISEVVNVKPSAP